MSYLNQGFLMGFIRKKIPLPLSEWCNSSTSIKKKCGFFGELIY